MKICISHIFWLFRNSKPNSKSSRFQLSIHIKFQDIRAVWTHRQTLFRRETFGCVCLCVRVSSVSKFDYNGNRQTWGFWIFFKIFEIVKIDRFTTILYLKNGFFVKIVVNRLILTFFQNLKPNSEFDPTRLHDHIQILNHFFFNFPIKNASPQPRTDQTKSVQLSGNSSTWKARVYWHSDSFDLVTFIDRLTSCHYSFLFTFISTSRNV